MMRGDIAIGARFGRLIVLSASGLTRWKERLWTCACDCGLTAVVQGKNLRKGTMSCGCLGPILASALRTKHGKRRSREYSSWRSMRDRCLRITSKDYPSYGGRGITICEKWDSFEQFLVDMGPRPDGLTLERLDVNGNYEPGNCAWATPREQQRNRRMVVMVQSGGEQLRMTEIAERSGISYGAAYQRAKKEGTYCATRR